jgi:hypothetical protein
VAATVRRCFKGDACPLRMHQSPQESHLAAAAAVQRRAHVQQGSFLVEHRATPAAALPLTTRTKGASCGTFGRPADRFDAPYQVPGSPLSSKSAHSKRGRRQLCSMIVLFDKRKVAVGVSDVGTAATGGTTGARTHTNSFTCPPREACRANASHGHGSIRQFDKAETDSARCYRRLEHRRTTSGRTRRR